MSRLKTKYLATLVPVGNRIHHQSGSESRTQGGCSDGIKLDARLNSARMVVGDQPLVYYYFYLFNIYFSGTGLVTVFTTGGGGVQDPSGLLRGIVPDAYSYKK